MDNVTNLGIVNNFSAVKTDVLTALIGRYSGAKYVGLWSYIATLRASFVALKYTEEQITQHIALALNNDLTMLQRFGVPAVDVSEAA
jgi:hypothetical protein